MRFIDEADIEVIAGHGGPGTVSFWREKYVPRGGPDGGDGGDGGSVIFRSTEQLSTLQDFRFRRLYRAPAGNKGSNANKAGRDGEDIVVRVPVGTQLKDAETGGVLFEFNEPDVEHVICKGGRGGKGNSHFATSTHQAPKFAQPGEEGETKKLHLELKLLADVGIIGFPNAGKSTLISRVSAARPKIADYPFTTRVPNLGVVDLGDEQSAVFADIPGLVEGAHKGLGLGHQFLRHIERTRAFIHVLDVALLLEMPEEEATQEILAQYQAIRRELGLFKSELLEKPEIMVINKTDLISAKLARAIAKVLSASVGREPILVSCATGSGLKELLAAVKFILPRPEVFHPELPDDPSVRSNYANAGNGMGGVEKSSPKTNLSGHA